jgi:hypothetical protein
VGERERIARIISPSAWRDMEGPWEADSRWLDEDHRRRILTTDQGYALAKADAILARPEPSEAVAEALKALEPYLDAIVCYASSMDEHEPNRLAFNARAAIAAYEAERSTP